MMMPANFSAVSENEMTYVMGGSVADYLAPVMGKKEWSNFSKNLVTIIGNSYLGNCRQQHSGCYLQRHLRSRRRSVQLRF